MPVGRSSPPKYRHYRPKNLAVVRIDGRDHYLGRFDSPESRERYDRLIAEWLIRRYEPKPAGSVTDAIPDHRRGISPSVNDLILAFWQHAKARYVKNGQPTSEIRSFRTALRPVRRLYGREPVTGFGPLALVACRQKLLEAGYCRKRINQHVGRIRHMFKWGVAREMVPETVWRALCAVEGLRVGEAPETNPIRPVSEARIAALEAHVSPQIWAMICLQLWSGCRPGEVCVMRTIDLNTQGPIWEYRPHSHKTQHHQKERVVYLGPQAQTILRPWLRTDLYAYLFSPYEAREAMLAQRRKNRKTPMTPSQAARRRKASPQRKPSDHYSNQAYARAIARACETAFGMPKELRRISGRASAEDRTRLTRLAAEWRKAHCWHPNQLRHNAATRIRSEFGIEAARVILGHSSAVTSEIYAEVDRQKAQTIVGQIG